MSSKAPDPGPKQLRTYTIYADPLDAPGVYVVRGFTITGRRVDPRPGPDGRRHSLDEARAALPPGLYSLGREPSDHPSIVETWI
jgi:hypothetical protein